MDQDPFELVDQTLRCRGAEAGFDLLVRLLREQKKYPLVFEARLMRARHGFGLPLVESGNISDLRPEQQPAYQTAAREAARETGSLFLADGDVVGAWPYFRVIGDPGPVADAIERLSPDDATEPVIQIALNERVNPRKRSPYCSTNTASAPPDTRTAPTGLSFFANWCARFPASWSPPYRKRSPAWKDRSRQPPASQS
jgi:hypothetical protein